MLFLICLIPIVIMGIGKLLFPKDVSLIEWAISIAASAIIFGAIALVDAIPYQSTELWSGEVTGKDESTTHFRESYDCRCKTKYRGTGKNRTSYRSCQTCYREGYDLSWWVKTSLGRVSIERTRCNTNNRMVCEARYPDPRFWKDAQNGDPVAIPHRYTNYIKGAAASLFQRAPQDANMSFPSYPNHVYDYYNVNRAVDATGTISDIREFSDEISLAQKHIGPNKQGNMIIVFAPSDAQTYGQYLMGEWEGAEKNDIIVVIEPDGNRVKSAWASSFSKANIVNIALRDAMLDWTNLDDPKATVGKIAEVVSEHYVRREMAEMEYLAESKSHSLGKIIGLCIFGIFAGLGMLYVARQTDL